MNEEIQAKAKAVVSVWDSQCGRVFESMGRDNPRAQAIDTAIQELENAFVAEENRKGFISAPTIAEVQSEIQKNWCLIHEMVKENCCGKPPVIIPGCVGPYCDREEVIETPLISPLQMIEGQIAEFENLETQLLLTSKEWRKAGNIEYSDIDHGKSFAFGFCAIRLRELLNLKGWK
jgi:hypothetical protein